MLRPVGLLVVLTAAWAAAEAPAKVFPFEALGVSDDWIAIRQNIMATAEDTAACAYPGLDPSEYVGSVVNFVRLPAEAKRGQLTLPGQPDASLPLYSPAREGQACTMAAEAEARWSRIVDRAAGLGITLSKNRLLPVLLGDAVPAKECVLMTGGTPCRRVFTQTLNGVPIRIAVSLTAVPEAPDYVTCQFMGHRLSAAIQVSGLAFGSAESRVAPGGFANHYDCRSQQFDPLRLYHMDGFAILLGGFRGTNIADRDEYPFFLVFPDSYAK